MENKIPLPTDNIYKFYALFGLLLFVFGMGSCLYLTKSTNAFMSASLVEVETLRALEKPSVGQETRKKVLERLMEVEQSDKKVFDWAIGVLVAAGTLLMVYGFTKWHTYIQPRQDELVELQLRKLRAEIGQRRRPR